MPYSRLLFGNRYYALRRRQRALESRAEASDLNAQRARQELTRQSQVEGDLQTQLSSLQASNAAQEARLALPSWQDGQRFEKFMQDYGPSCALIRFARTDYMVDFASRGQMDLIEVAMHEWRSDPTNYQNPDLAQSYALLVDKLRIWRGRINVHYFPRHGTPSAYGIPHEWQNSNLFDDATRELLDASGEFVEQYDAFLRLAGEKNLV